MALDISSAKNWLKTHDESIPDEKGTHRQNTEKCIRFNYEDDEKKIF